MSSSYTTCAEHTISAAADQLNQSLQASSSSHCLQISNNDCSLNTALSEAIPPSDVVTGMRPGGRMSVVRRFFCLFVTFDLLFTVLMWLICLMLLNEDVFKMMSDQIVHYSIHTSLFDIVMAAAARFVILLLFYALLYINHWCIIALSTAGTCSFLITKVFLYNWVAASSPVFQVLLILTSFVISWGEAWFLDFRVIPQEVLAQGLVQAPRVANERSPLLQPYLQHLQAHHDDNPESVRNFYSPVDSCVGSDDEDDVRLSRPATSTPKHHVTQDSALRVRAREALMTSWKTLCSSGWRREKENDLGDKVDSRARPTGGKIYRLEGDISTSPESILQMLFNKVDSLPLWNPTLTLARRLEVIDEQTDVSYHIMAESAGGLFTARDLVTLRRWERRGPITILASISISHPAAPVTKEHVRANQGPSCFVMEPTSRQGQTRLRWLVDTEMNGWVPQSLVDQAFSNVMLQWMGFLRTHASALKSTRPHTLHKEDDMLHF